MTKIGLVTGSTSNIGRAIAEALSRQGFHVIVTSRHGHEAKGVADTLPHPGSFFQVDFSRVADINNLFSFVKEHWGRIDVLVNNVAYTRNESILECDLETWQLTLATNLSSYYLCTKYAAELMREQGGGSIVNVTVSSSRGTKDKFSYMTSKGGVNYLTMCAAIDLAPHNIRVNAVGSGLVGTPVGYREYVGRTYDQERIPLGHIGEPEDVAQAVVFLVSDKAKYITGAIVPVDGGLNTAL